MKIIVNLYTRSGTIKGRPSRTTLLRNISDSTYFSLYGLESADFIGVSGGVIKGSIGETNDICCCVG
jgi:hypothetical protein